MDWTELPLECCNEHSGSIECGKFLHWLRTRQLFKNSALWSYLGHGALFIYTHFNWHKYNNYNSSQQMHTVILAL